MREDLKMSSYTCRRCNSSEPGHEGGITFVVDGYEMYLEVQYPYDKAERERTTVCVKCTRGLLDFYVVKCGLVASLAAPPSDHDIVRIEEWRYEHGHGWIDLLAYVRKLWHIPDWGWKEHGRKFELSTGGWSDNESIIEALQGNVMFWMVCWVSSRRGGHYVFEIPEKLE